MLGTDYPYPWTSTALDHIVGTTSLSDTEPVAALDNTAYTLLGIAA
jgi:aminocarboxymuconate-semialdehyde decarboxylase